jgi:hypothetical protein
MLGRIDINAATDLAPQAHFGITFVEADAGTALAQRLDNFVLGIAQARHDSKTGYDYTAHIGSLEIISGSEQADAKILGLVNFAAINRYGSICDRQH